MKILRCIPLCLGLEVKKAISTFQVIENHVENQIPFPFNTNVWLGEGPLIMVSQINRILPLNSNSTLT